MLSRRSFFSGFVAAPAVIAVASLMPLRGVSLGKLHEVASPRSRLWTATLAPDLSSDFVKDDGSRFLDKWIDAQEPSQGLFQPNSYASPTLDEMRAKIEADKAAVIERSNPWQELNDLQAALRRDNDYDLQVPIEAKVYDEGTWFESDVGPHHDENMRRRLARALSTPFKIVKRTTDDRLSITELSRDQIIAAFEERSY